MLAFVKIVAFNLVFGAALGAWCAKPGRRLYEAGGMVLTTLAISAMMGILVLLGVPVHGIWD